MLFKGDVADRSLALIAKNEMRDPCTNLARGS
jgi:hypothetical protein